jgi:hypothetical protein
MRVQISDDFFKFYKCLLLTNSIGKVDRNSAQVFNDLKHVKLPFSGCCGCSISESNNVNSDILNWVCAAIGVVCAEGRAVILSSWAILPTDWAMARITFLARRIGKKIIIRVEIFFTWDTGIFHERGAIWWADAASDIVEVCSAFRVKKGSPPFTTKIRMFTDTIVIISISFTTSVRRRLCAKVTGDISEAIRTILFAILSILIVTRFARCSGKCSILFFSLYGRSGYLTHSTAISMLPTVWTIDLTESVAQ